jgi:hypothetical protein
LKKITETHQLISASRLYAPRLDEGNRAHMTPDQASVWDSASGSTRLFHFWAAGKRSTQEK